MFWHTLFIWHSMLLGPSFCTKNKKKCFEGKNSMERLVSVFYIKRPNNVECCIYKITKSQHILVTVFLLSSKSSITERERGLIATKNNKWQSIGPTQYSSTLMAVPGHLWKHKEVPCHFKCSFWSGFTPFCLIKGILITHVQLYM